MGGGLTAWAGLTHALRLSSLNKSSPASSSLSAASILPLALSSRSSSSATISPSSSSENGMGLLAGGVEGGKEEGAGLEPALKPDGPAVGDEGGDLP